MKKHAGLTLCGIIAGSIWLTGCAAQTGTPMTVSFPNEIGVRNAQADTITVRASESVKVVPDMAQAVFVIVTENKDADACQQENTRKLDQVLAFLKEQGTAEESIRTSDFTLNPQYDWSGNTRRLTGYEMRTALTVTDIPVDETGKLLSNVVAAGANEIQSVSYFSSEYDKAYEEALAKAVEMAKGKAEAMAHAGGCQVTGILNIEEAFDNQAGRYTESGLRNLAMDAAAEQMESAVDGMAVMPGQMHVTADIEVTFNLVVQ